MSADKLCMDEDTQHHYLWYNSSSGKLEPDHEMKILVPVLPEPEVILKILVPVIPTRIGMPKFHFQFRLGIDPLPVR